MRRISSKDDLELITERREKREVTFKNVNGHCSRIKAPDLDKNGLPIIFFRNNNDFDTLYNRSCVDQSEYPPQRPRAHSEVTTSSRTCIDQFNPYLGYFVFAAEDQPVKKSPDKKGRDFFQRYNLLSNAKLRARKDRKLNPLSGEFHHTPGKYSVLHNLYGKARKLSYLDDTQVMGQIMSPRATIKRSDSKDDLQLGVISEVSQELFYKLNDEAPQILSDYYAHRNLLRSLKFTNEDRPLGCGSFASVLHAAIGATGRRKVAVKYFKKLSPEFNEKESEEQTKNIKNEVALMKLMRRGSRHLVRYIDCLELPGKVYLVMELCSAGDLENMLFTRRRLKEEEIKCIARQMLSALKFLHDMGIIHGDIKASNILFQLKCNPGDQSPDSPKSGDVFRSPLGLTLKICDFGASRRVCMHDEVDAFYGGSYGSSSSLDSMDEDGFGIGSSIPFELIGTEGYLSPEQLRGERLSSAIDMWAMGVVLYKCVTGYLPYRPSSACFSSTALNYDGPLWSCASVECRHVTKQCLHMDAFYRMTAKEGSRDSWFNDLNGTPPPPIFEPTKPLGDRERTLLAFLTEVNDDADRANFVITDPDLDDNPIIYASESFCKLTQYKKDEIEGRNCRFLQGPRTNPTDIVLMRENINNRKATSCKILNYRKDGSQFVNQLFIQPLFSRNKKKICYFVGIQKEMHCDYMEIAQDMEGNFGYRLFNWM